MMRSVRLAVGQNYRHLKSFSVLLVPLHELPKNFYDFLWFHFGCCLTDDVSEKLCFWLTNITLGRVNIEKCRCHFMKNPTHVV